MSIKRVNRGIKRHKPLNGIHHPGIKTAAGQSRRFIALMGGEGPTEDGGDSGGGDPQRTYIQFTASKNTNGTFDNNVTLPKGVDFDIVIKAISTVAISNLNSYISDRTSFVVYSDTNNAIKVRIPIPGNVQILELDGLNLQEWNEFTVSRRDKTYSLSCNGLSVDYTADIDISNINISAISGFSWGWNWTGVFEFIKIITDGATTCLLKMDDAYDTGMFADSVGNCHATANNFDPSDYQVS